MNDIDARTVWCGNLSSEVTEELLYELFLQAGPLENVKIPKDTNNGRSKSFAFIIYKHQCSVPYAIQLLSGECLFGRQLLVQNRTTNQSGLDPPSPYGILHNSPQTPTIFNNFSLLGNGPTNSPYFVNPFFVNRPFSHPLFPMTSELIVLDDDGSTQNQLTNRIQKSGHQNLTDDVQLIDYDQRQNNGRQHNQNNRATDQSYGQYQSNRPHQQRTHQSPALRVDSVMRNPWEQLEDNSPNTSRQQRQNHGQRRRSSYDNRRRY